MPLRRLVAPLCLLLLLSPARAQPETETPETTIITGGWLFDATDDARVRNPGLVVRAGKILAIGNTRLDTTDARRLRLADDATILPGLLDLHAHYAVDFFGEGRVEEIEGYPLLYLANGATTTFTSGEMDPEKMQRLRDAIDRGDRIGPRLLTSGPYFGTARPGWDNDRSPESIRAEVDEWAARGTRHFKAKRIRPAHLRALIDQAHQHGATVTAHLGSGYGDSVNPRDAISMGIDRIEHFMGGDQLPDSVGAYDSLPTASPNDPAFHRIGEHFIAHRVYFDATITAYGYFGAQDPEVFDDYADNQQYLTPYMRDVLAERPPHEPRQVFEDIYRIKLERIKAFYDAGGGALITLGTDHPSWGQFLAPFGVHRELHAFVNAGIPPAAALRFATQNAARAVGLSDRLGTVEVGKWADLVVIAGNPLADIQATRNVQWVMKAGRLHRAADLKAAAQGTIGPVNPMDAEAWKPQANR